MISENVGLKNFPAISDAGTMDRYPHVRRLERDTLIQQIEWGDNFNVVDIQSAAGYVSDRVYELRNGRVVCYCVEPCEILRQRHNRRVRHSQSPADDV